MHVLTLLGKICWHSTVFDSVDQYILHTVMKFAVGTVGPQLMNSNGMIHLSVITAATESIKLPYEALKLCQVAHEFTT